MKVLKIQI